MLFSVSEEARYQRWRIIMRNFTLRNPTRRCLYMGPDQQAVAVMYHYPAERGECRRDAHTCHQCARGARGHRSAQASTAVASVHSIRPQLQLPGRQAAALKWTCCHTSMSYRYVLLRAGGRDLPHQPPAPPQSPAQLQLPSARLLCPHSLMRPMAPSHR
jgi:hypothetical protein